MVNSQSPITNSQHNVEEQRRRYVTAFNDTMIKIWREQIVLLGVVDTGALYRSLLAVRMSADGKFTQIQLEQSFNKYGLYQDFGTGSNTAKGNPGDLGEGFTNKRTRRRWFSRKYFASVMNLREFFADNLGRDLADTVSNALSRSAARHFVT